MGKQSKIKAQELKQVKEQGRDEGRAEGQAERLKLEEGVFVFLNKLVTDKFGNAPENLITRLMTFEPAQAIPCSSASNSVEELYEYLDGNQQPAIKPSY